eukprot:CAMPEP_0170911306 /NCGR_PEP_ID=MMETSP0735-20130129/3612_1 /TAXON_ID=186038 /ORGANISM="Fragilariopsis kerguelensis, Strain L26-C5" /LENGTH=413 /DNA_ID=CAMNT_0011308175 /DNA_START=137 /DNA_END=1378 /DNA_ORIENTATION=-
MSIGKPVIKYKKAPQAPKRFKSSYMFFSTIKHKEIRTELIANITEEGQKIKTTDVAKLVSKAWKALPAEEREQWEEIARQDKARYEIEKLTYTGPWKVPIYAATTRQPQPTKHKNHKKCNQGPPKRPLSAFFSFSKAKRSYVTHKYSDATPAEIPSILAQLWKVADPNEKKWFLEEQIKLEQSYNLKMIEWDKKSKNSSAGHHATRTHEPMLNTTSMGMNNTNNSSSAYCTDMAANTFDDLLPYSSLSMSSALATANTPTGAGVGGATAAYSGYDPYNQGQQHQLQYPYQQQYPSHQPPHPQHYPQYDHPAAAAAAAYNYRNPYGDAVATAHLPSSTYGYPLPPASASAAAAAAAFTSNATSYERGIAAGYESSNRGGGGSSQPPPQHSAYDYNTAHLPLPTAAAAPPTSPAL